MVSSDKPPKKMSKSASSKVSPNDSPSTTQRVIWAVLVLAIAVGFVSLVGLQDALLDTVQNWVVTLPTDPMEAALAIMEKAPVIDGHIDTPLIARMSYQNNATAMDLSKDLPSHVDVPKLRKGKVGGFFWSIYVPCAKPEEEGTDYLNATWQVRDTLEQIDITKLLLDKHSDDFQFATSTREIKAAIKARKIAGLLGIEGGHSLGNSIAAMRQFYALGVRYLTLTHWCHNAFADSCGLLESPNPVHGGLSALGRSLIDEMNRLGVMVDLSHTSDDTARQAFTHSKAPVIWSHSSSRTIHDVPRNLPDDILHLIGEGGSGKDAIVMVNFADFFIAKPGKATVGAVADHVEHIARIAGKKHIGIGSDYDGIGIDEVPIGLEDVSKYPALIAELYQRGWTRSELAGLTNGNLLRVLEGVERTAKKLQSEGTLPVMNHYQKRTDIPAPEL